METEIKKKIYEARNCEDADREIQKMIKDIWNASLKSFAEATTEEEKKDIVRSAIIRGCVPHHLNCEDETEVYTVMKEKTTPQKISHQNAIYINLDRILQNG